MSSFPSWTHITSLISSHYILQAGYSYYTADNIRPPIPFYHCPRQIHRANTWCSVVLIRSWHGENVIYYWKEWLYWDMTCYPSQDFGREEIHWYQDASPQQLFTDLRDIRRQKPRYQSLNFWFQETLSPAPQGGKLGAVHINSQMGITDCAGSEIWKAS